MKMEGLVEGRIVHFVLTTNLDKEKSVVCRPAIIVNAWDGRLEDGMVNLQVFLDGRNDEALFPKSQMADFLNIGMPLTVWATSVKYSETKEVGTWHWPERN